MYTADAEPAGRSSIDELHLALTVSPPALQGRKRLLASEAQPASTKRRRPTATAKGNEQQGIAASADVARPRRSARKPVMLHL